MKLTTEPGKSGKIYLYTDGEYRMSMDADTWYSLSYRDGDEIDEEELTELKNLVSSRLAYAQALRFLTLRSHSAQELYGKLLKKHSPESAEYAVEKCRELGFIDDEDFAERYARELAEKKHHGPARIKTELLNKGIDKEIISNVLETLDIDFSSCIIDVIEKKYYNCLSDKKGRDKTVAALMRLGYSYSMIKEALSEYKLSEDGEYEY